MPRRTRRRTSRRRSSFRRRRVSRRTSSRRRASVGRVRGSLIPDRFFVRLKYSEVFGMSYAGAGFANYYQFRTNSLYDPNLTGTGHQPLGYDAWSSFYSRYRVRGMSYVVTFTNIETAAQMEVAITLRPNVTVDTTIETIRESPSCVYKSILGTEGSGQANKSTRGYASVAKMRGVSKTRVNAESDYQALVTASPVLQPIMTIYVINQDTSAAALIRVRVDFVYHCEFFDRKVQYQS